MRVVPRKEYYEKLALYRKIRPADPGWGYWARFGWEAQVEKDFRAAYDMSPEPLLSTAVAGSFKEFFKRLG